MTLATGDTAAPLKPSLADDKPHSPPPPAKLPAPARTSRWSPLRLGVAALIIIGVLVLLVLYWSELRLLLTTVSTDDAYVNSHATFVAPRVAGQVTRVFVDDNNRVKKGDLLVQLDKEPYQVDVDLQKANLAKARADLEAAHDQVRGMIAQARSNRFKLEHSIEVVDNQIAQLRAAVATLETRKATHARAQADFERAQRLFQSKVVSQAQFDLAQETQQVAQAQVREAVENVIQLRAGLGLTPQPKSGNLGEVPENLDQNFSSVRQALADLLGSAAPLGIVPKSYNESPREVIAEFYRRDPKGDIDRIYAQVQKQAAAIKQAEASLMTVKQNLAQAELNLRYCDIVSEIDGVVTRRNINPGNNVLVGQSLMVVRSLTPPDLWIDANFKETQLAQLRIGQRAELHVDMYGKRRIFEGRISGFTMGTGSTLALLPPQNATGNFVKIVQRLPVRIEVLNYSPDDNPLFVGLSVEPHVFIHEPPTGPDAGKFLQPYQARSEGQSPAQTAPGPSGPVKSGAASMPGKNAVAP